MGADNRKKAAPPLPPPTETESTIQSVAPTEPATATDLSKPSDTRSSYSLPEDGTPVTIKTRSHRANKSQTSLLIEYFEAGKGSAPGSSDQRRPSVRVRLTPSSKKGKNGTDRDHIQITETRTRTASLSRRSRATSPVAATRSEIEALSEDAKSMESYASATEESNVSRNPIDIEIDRSGNMRRRRPASPLIPAADANKTSYIAPNMSDISAIPTDSFLDGSGPSASVKMSEPGKRSRSRSPSRLGDVLAGTAAGLAGAAVADRLRSKSRGETRDRERVVLPKNRDKERSSKHRPSKSRTSSREEKHSEDAKSERRRSSKSQQESAISAPDSSVVSSALTQQSMRSGASKTSSINNPKLLETVEDAIRRLILPELNALKREQSKHKDRRGSTNSSTTSLSREDYGSERRRSGTDKNATTPRDSLRLREARDREARNDFDESPAPSGISQESVEEIHAVGDTPMRSTDRLKTVAAGAGLGAAAAALHEVLYESPSDDKRSRRRRRTEMRSRSSDRIPEDFAKEDHLSPVPPMPLMGEINPSEVTRTSILSAETDRPHSATEELTPVHDVSRGELSSDSSPTPTKAPVVTLQSLGAQHANISRGDLRALPHKRDLAEDYEAVGYGDQRLPLEQSQDDYDEEEDYEHAGQAVDYCPPSPYDYYGHQEVPPPLRYVPYQPERRGLSPIPSISGYTEGGSEPLNRDSRVTQSAGSISSPDKSPRQDGSMHSPDSVPSNVLSRDFDEERSFRSSGVDHRYTTYTDDSETGQAVRAVGLTPNIVHTMGVESNVASLVDGSMLDESVLTAESGRGGGRAYSPRHSVITQEEDERSQSHPSPAKRSVEIQHEYLDEQERGDTPVSASQRSRGFAEEYDVDEYGRKVPLTRDRQSPTESEAAITGAAVGAAAAAIRAQRIKAKQPAVEDIEEEHVPAGVQRNKSFKERTLTGQRPGLEPKHSVDRLVDEHEPVRMGFSGLPLAEEPMPDGPWQEEDLQTNPSMLDGQADNVHREDEEDWAGEVPRQQAAGTDDLEDYDDEEQRQAAEDDAAARQKRDGQGLGISETAGAAAISTAAALVASHNQNQQQPSLEHEEDWYRTSEDHKRDTILTNPYEGTSPIANPPGLNANLLGTAGYGNNDYGNDYGTRSPLGPKVDEGYISQGPNKTPDAQAAKGKAIDYPQQPAMDGLEDPFYAPARHDKYVSGLSQGMGSPFYDAATGTGIERIESKDIVALMQHLMVRDAQRSARDTEILVTIVRAAAEMRNSFDDIKRMLADTEDQIITEVKDNTDKSIQRAINGPRPYPGSATRSLQGTSQAGTVNGDDLPAKRRNIFRRALKGLSSKSTNDLTRIEEMLMQLLAEVDVLRAQTAPGPGSASTHDGQSFNNLQPEVQYEQDRGYEPEGNAGTSTASHASQSGHLSIPGSRGASTKLGYDRKISGPRISTVHESNEDDYNPPADLDETADYGQPDPLLTPTQGQQRGGSMPLATPPQTATQGQASMSNENTPRTDEGKKHAKSGSRSSWFPKISRWSETTTSSVAQAFRRSGQSRKTEDEGPAYETTNFQRGPSRSGSLGAYSDNLQFSDPHASVNKLHTGFSDQELGHGEVPEDDEAAAMYGAEYEADMAGMSQDRSYASMTPEDPKYKAHRNSLNLQHPQPRQAQIKRFNAALESQALGYDSPKSPRSADWAGSATSLHRFQRNANRDSYGSAGDQANRQQEQQQDWATSSPGPSNVTGTGGPPRPPKEPLGGQDGSSPLGLRGTPPKSGRGVNKLQKASPLPHHSVESGYGTMTHGVPTASYISHSRDGGSSPRLENRNLSGALGAPTRRPSGPRAMTPKSMVSGAGSDDGAERRKRDTFGTLASQDTDTF